MPDETTKRVETKILNDESVGYRKPPARTRFQKGQSGNPTGRRNGTKNLKTDLAEELQEAVTVREGERATKISKQRAIVKTLVNKTLKGDNTAARALLNQINKLFSQQDAVDDVDESLDADDVEVLEAFEKRALARLEAEAGGVGAPVAVYGPDGDCDGDHDSDRSGGNDCEVADGPLPVHEMSNKL